MQFNQEAATKSGLTGIGTGAHIGGLTAKKILAQSGAKGIEFTLETETGMSVNYLTLYYQKNDGTDIARNVNMIQSVMGILRLQNLAVENLAHEQEIKELSGQQIGLVLQKVLKYKADGVTETYGFDICQVFSANTRQTYNEAISKIEPTAVDKMVSTLEDRNERTASKPVQMGATSTGGFSMGQGLDDDDLDF